MSCASRIVLPVGRPGEERRRGAARLLKHGRQEGPVGITLHLGGLARQRLELCLLEEYTQGAEERRVGPGRHVQARALARVDRLVEWRQRPDDINGGFGGPRRAAAARSAGPVDTRRATSAASATPGKHPTVYPQHREDSPLLRSASSLMPPVSERGLQPAERRRLPLVPELWRQSR